jgi:glycogen operon protein
MASRVCGSDDLYLKSGRSPGHSINFLTAHDGFTLNDLVSYSQKHNQANGENNQDGESHNHSENFGVEGPSGDQTVREKRRRQTKNLLATLFLSQGVPMLLAGDEFARTQQGNNNAYCQDNPISWVNWELVRENGDLLRFVRLMIKFRHDHPSLRRSHFFHGQGGITWHGERENEPDWSDEGKCLAFLLDGGQAKREKGDCDDDVFVALNAADNWRHVTVPGRGREWLKMIDTSRASPEDIIENPDQAPRLGQRIDRLAVEPRSLLVLINPRG